MSKINVAIIGAGYWGKNLIRVFHSSEEVNLKYVCDLDENKLLKIKNFYPGVKTIKDSKIIFSDPEISAVLIATPTSSHYILGKESLFAGKHTFIEKPITETSAQAQELIGLANERNLVLMVDHTFLYTGAVRKIKQLIKGGELGEMRYFDSERINLGLIQSDINVIYDLAPHDISILNYIIDEKPVSVLAFGKSYITRNSSYEVEEVAHIHLDYLSGFAAHIHVSWLSPVKLRKTLIGGSKKMVLYNDVEPSEKIKIFNHGVDIDFSHENSFFPTYRSGDIAIPQLENYEALAIEAQEFIKAIKENKKPLTSGENGLEAVRILEKATKSIRQGGIKINL